MSEQDEVGSELEIPAGRAVARNAVSDGVIVDGGAGGAAGGAGGGAGDAAGDGTVDGTVGAVLDVPVMRPIARRDARIGPAVRHPQWMINQLPVGMLGSDFFVRFMSIFQDLAETLMDGADQVQHVPDAAVAPTPLLSYLASWIDVRTVDPSLPDEVQRVILRSSARALALRGTRRGLTQYLQMLSGGEAEVTDGGGVWREGEAPDDTAWVTMRVTSTGHLSEGEFVALIRDEVPAHVRAELYVADRRVLATEEER